MDNNEAEMKFCKNCKRSIAMTNYDLHIIHCEKNLAPCEKCGEPIPRSKMREHIDEEHAEVICELCNSRLEKQVLEDHKVSSCTQRLCCCSFCEQKFPACELEEHEVFCGARTEPCPLCRKNVLRRDLERHEQLGCQADVPKPKPQNPPNVQVARGRKVEPVAATRSSRQVTRRRERNDHTAFVPTFSRSTKSVVQKTDFEADKLLALKLQEEEEAKSRDFKLARQLEDELNSGGSSHHTMTNDEEDEDKDALLLARRFQEEEKEMSRDHLLTQKFHENGVIDVDTLDTDDLPCENCQALFPPHMLLEHQVSCAVGFPGLFTEMLHSPDLPQLSMTSDDKVEKVSSDMYMEEDLLPCEFCDDLFPPDQLFQHQPVCPRNHTMTPRVRSAAVVKPQRPRVTRQQGTTSGSSSRPLPTLMKQDRTQPEVEAAVTEQVTTQAAPTPAPRKPRQVYRADFSLRNPTGASRAVGGSQGASSSTRRGGVQPRRTGVTGKNTPKTDKQSFPRN